METKHLFKLKVNNSQERYVLEVLEGCINDSINNCASILNSDLRDLFFQITGEQHISSYPDEPLNEEKERLDL